MLNRFLEHINRQHLFPQGQEVLLAVSGGRDSVALLHLCHAAHIPIAVAHANFHLRPGDCDRDEAFVRQLAKRYGAEVHVASFDTQAYAASHGQSIEEAARTLRYAFFARLCNERAYPCVATAHHRDDSVETFFLNLFRGSGVAGLAGIRPASCLDGLRVIHPLLPFSRAEIDRYVEAEGLDFVEDSTNAEPCARRNRIRLQLMPLLRDLYPSVDSTVVATMERMADMVLLLDREVQRLRAEVFRPWPSVLPGMEQALLAADIAALKNLSPRRTLLYELLRPFGVNSAVAADIEAALETPAGQLFDTHSHRLTLHRGHLLLASRDLPPAPQVLCREVQAMQATDGHRSIYVDADLLAHPLTVRPWQAADRFHPFGMKGTRLVSDFLADKSLCRLERPSVHLLVDAQERVVWVIGLRPDDRFRVSDTTRRVAHLSI